LDIGVLATPLNDPELSELDLYTEPFMIFDSTGDSTDEKVRMQDLDYGKLCLLQEGHCLRTQVHQICEMSDRFADRDVNYEFESGSLDSLLRITKTRKGLTIIPFLASIDLPKRDQRMLVEFESPVPVRTVGLITHKYFVKKQLLKELQAVIKTSVSDLIPLPQEAQVMQPI
jgi:LysR family hydrogen peroxide-inducible transcriptional activator